LQTSAAASTPQTFAGGFALLRPRSYFGRVMELQESIAIHVNGGLARVPVGVTIAEMLGELGIDPRKVAVERNLAIVPRSSFGEVRVEEGDQYEVVHFVGGG